MEPGLSLQRDGEDLLPCVWRTAGGPHSAVLLYPLPVDAQPQHRAHLPQRRAHLQDFPQWRKQSKINSNKISR
jgi:hypothetical protein